jgi:hypothetical protein
VSPRGRATRGISAFAAFLVLASVLFTSSAHAGANLQLADPAAQPGYVPPGANLATTPPPPRPVTQKWWFWAAVGGAVAATVVVIIVASKDPSPPASTLGNMDIWKGK